LWQSGRYAEADRLLYHQDSRTADLFGNLFVQQQGLRLTADKGHLELDDDRGWLSDTAFRLTDRHARGSAARAELLGDSLSRYDQVIYTTCPPGHNDWSVRASEMDIDMDKGWGVARHARINLGPVPILYTPYLSFPVDDRRMSGFLVPSIGSSNRLGGELKLPYYFNLAENYDATLSPRWMTKRGLMLGGELRYLDAYQHAEISGEILPNDRVENDLRRAVKFQHGSHLAKGLTTRIDVTSVSDNDYLSDFGTGLAITSTRNLERVGEVAYRNGRLFLLGRLQEFQTIDVNLSPIQYPYRRLPQLLARYGGLLGDSNLNFNLSAEYTDFQHDTLINGKRFTFRPSLTLPMQRSWGHLTPRVSLNYASYRLDEEQAPTNPRPDYFVPAFSLDSGLVFERQTSWFGNSAYQTLEPRLYYLYAPFDDQSAIPDFDTADLDLSFANLFKENRFTGSDRFGDANQLSFGLTTRWLEADSGVERLRASIGQIYYQQPRQVQLTGPIEENVTSSVVAEVSTRIGRYWRSILTLRRDPHLQQDNIDRGRLGIHYRTPDQHLLNLDYNFSRNTIEDLDLSFNWPFSRRFTLTGKWKYSYLYDRNMNRILGFEYGGSCCWKLRALFQSYVANEDIDQVEDKRFMLQLELTGLGALGDTVDETLEEYIYGYRIQK
jgi:LPS-assembly protein